MAPSSLGRLALFERIDEQALRPARQQTFEVDLAEVQRQLAQIVVALDEDVEGAELDLVIVAARVQRLEVAGAVHA